MYAQQIKAYIESNYIPEPNSGCWLWLGGYTVNGGYGYLYIHSVQHRAHRVSYELFCGPIPEGLLVRHTCDVTCCINPQHLKLGDDFDNAQDRLERNRYSCNAGDIHSNTNLTDEDIRNIRLMSSTMTQQVIADKYGMTQAAVGKIVNRKTWAHVK